MKILLSQFSQMVKQSFDLSILMCSFEERSVSLLKHVDSRQLGKVVAIYNEESVECVAQYDQIKERLGSDVIAVPVTINNPLEFADKVLNCLKSCDSPNNVLLDITTFTHEALLITLKLLSIAFPRASITYAYTNAKEYSSKEAASSKWLSRGIGNSRSVLGYAGQMDPCKKDRLIVLVGYEFERAMAAISLLEPSSLTLAYGTSDNATTELDRDANCSFAGLVRDMAFTYPNIDMLEISCNDPDVTTKVLSQYILNHSDENIIILPMNNKLSTIAVANLQSILPFVQICYVPAEVYNVADYSEPGDYVYIGVLRETGLE